MVEDKAQLKCQICDSKRLLTVEEITESISVMRIRNLKPDQILNLWSAYDGDTCPEGGNHNYEWNPAFREDIMDKANKRRKADLDIVKYNNECEELARASEKLEADTLQKLKEIMENKDKKVQEIQTKITENENVISELEGIKPALEEEILKTSGRDWKGWL
jgi:hypothetical protein